jgi:hypothetical protein
MKKWDSLQEHKNVDLSQKKDKELSLEVQHRGMSSKGSGTFYSEWMN